MKIEDEEALEKIEEFFEEQEAFEYTIKKLSVQAYKARRAAWKLIHDVTDLPDNQSFIWNKKTKEVTVIEE